jgi:hypothetical protein
VDGETVEAGDLGPPGFSRRDRMCIGENAGRDDFAGASGRFFSNSTRWARE